MRKSIMLLQDATFFIFLLLLFGCQEVQLRPVEEDNFLGPQSDQAKGEQYVLMVAVQFPDVQPTISLEQLRKKVIGELNQYLNEQSYGLTWMKVDFRGWIKLPSPLAAYKISPYNFKVDRTRVRKLFEDTMTALEKEVDFSPYQHVLIIPGAVTQPGKGYGMMCYCANPGMLSGARGNLRYITLKSKEGKEFEDGIFVGTENAHLGMFAHDFFHALGGLYGERRMVPCLYDFNLQSDASRIPSPEHHAIYMGPWDIMSEHFVKREEPPPGISSFTKIRLGWISPGQVRLVNPGETASAFLVPLAKKGDSLAVKIPLKGGEYYLVENRQPIGFDRFLPDSGILILKVNPEAEEGSGTVKIMDADPKSPHFAHATYKLLQNKRNIFMDQENNLAIIPLWPENGTQGVLITTGEKGDEAFNAALMIQKLLQDYSLPGGSEESRLVNDCLAAFKRNDFNTASQIAQKGLNH